MIDRIDRDTTTKARAGRLGAASCVAFVLRSLVALAAVLLFAMTSGCGTTRSKKESLGHSSRALTGNEPELYVVAHIADDVLFLNPDLENSIRAGRSVRVVIITSGLYNYDSESAQLDAYALMANTASTWNCTAKDYAGKTTRFCSLVTLPTVSVVFLRLPESYLPGLVSIEYGPPFWVGPGDPVTTLDEAATYTRSDLVYVLLANMQEHAPGLIALQNNTLLYDNENGDHIAAAYATLDASHLYAPVHEHRWYRRIAVDDSDDDDPPNNLSQAEHDEKVRVMLPLFAPVDPDSSYDRWAWRRYTFSQAPNGTGAFAGRDDLCLDATTGGADGAAVRPMPCNGSANQTWALRTDQQILGPGGRCLTIDTDGLSIVTRDCADAPRQKWTYLANGQLLGEASRCLGIREGGPVVVAELCQGEGWPPDVAVRQHWTHEITGTTQAPAVPVITTATTATAGQTGLVASITTRPGMTYSWSLSSGMITSAGGHVGVSSGSTNSITFRAGPSGTLTVSCVETNGAAIDGPPGTATVAIAAATPHTPAITAPAAVTAGKGGLTASVTAIPGMTYGWTINGGTLTNPGGAAGVTNSVAAKNTITFTAGPPGILSLGCTESDGTTTTAPGTATVTVVAPPQQPTITAPSGPVHPAQPGLTASVTARPGMTNRWSIAGGPTSGTITSPGGAAGVTSGGTNTITFTAGIAGSTTLHCVERNEAGDDSAPGSATVAIGDPIAGTGHMYVVARQEDELWFMNPDVEDSIRTGHPVRTVFLTSVGSDLGYNLFWEERGMRAHAAMAGVSDAFTCAPVFYTGKAAVLCSLTDHPHVSSLFLRLPGEIESLWARAPGPPLWTDPVTSLTSTNGAATFTKSELVEFLAAAMADFAPSFVGTQDSTLGYGFEFRDRVAAGFFALEAAHRYESAHDFKIYRGLSMQKYLWMDGPLDEERNLTPEQHDEKRRIVTMMEWGPFNDDTEEDRWCWRRYAIARAPNGTGPLLSTGGRCVGVIGGSPVEGAAAGMADCAETPAQTWTIRADQQMQGIGGKCLTVHNDGRSVRISECAGLPEQKWTLTENGQLRSVEAKCFTVGDDPNSVSVEDCEWDQSEPRFKPVASQRWTHPLTGTTVQPAAPAITTVSSAAAGDEGLVASVNVRPGMSYAWTIVGGAITGVGSAAGVTENGKNTITFRAGGAGTLRLGCVETNGVGEASAPGTATVAVHAATPKPPTIVAPPFVTEGKAGLTAQVTAIPGMTYTWAISGGAVTGPGGTSGVTVGIRNTVTFTAGSIGTLTLTCTESDGSSTSAPASRAIEVVSAPVQPIVSAASPVNPAQDGLTASVPAHAGMTYVWSITNGTITGPGGASGVTYNGVNTVAYRAGIAGHVVLTAIERNSAGDDSSPGSATVVIGPPLATTAHLYVVAHPPDAPIFLNPDLENAMLSGHAVRVVYVTSGEGGGDLSMAQEQEESAMRSQAAMAALPDTWTCTTRIYAGKNVRSCSLDAHPFVSAVFLRIPDGHVPELFQYTDGGPPFWGTPAASLTTVDGANTYTRSNLVDTIKALMVELAPEVIGTLDNTFVYGDDYWDHFGSALFALEAGQAYGAVRDFKSYQGANLFQQPPFARTPRPRNLTQAEHDEKVRIMDVFAQPVTPGSDQDEWCWRRYAASRVYGTVGPISSGGKCLDLSGTPADGTPLVMTACVEGSANQTWSVSANGQIQGAGGKCLSVTAAFGTILRDCNGADTQRWTMLDIGQLRGLRGTCLTVLEDGVTPVMRQCEGEESLLVSTVPTPQRWISLGTCPASCDDGNVCTTDECSGGACRHTPVAPGTSCSDGNACNGVETCNASGNCIGTPVPTSDATCDGVDDDCDGQVDEDYAPVATACGVGACGTAGTSSCVAGHVQNNCTPGTPATSDATCNGVDDDCDGQTDEDYVSVVTTCGVGACAATGRTSCTGGSVQNSCAPGSPAPTDATCNGVDDDCDGQVDENYVSVATTCGVGACVATGHTACVNGQVQESCTPGAPAPTDATCNGADDDCNGQVDEDYVPHATTCGTGVCRETGVTSCLSGVEHDSCQAGTAGGTDTSCNGIDDNCNGQVDEGYQPHSTACGVGACAATGTSSCANGVENNNCNVGTPAANDATCDGIDDDCDGLVDENYAPVATNCGVGACHATGTTSCTNGHVTNSCTPGSAGANDATCDGIDDDCDGQIDEDYAGGTTNCGVGACARTGTRTCSGGTVHDSCAPGTAAANDATCDGIDDDCDGLVDEDYGSTPTTCGVGACGRTGTRSCVNGAVQDSCSPGTAAANDAICNGVDDDCNGQTDEDYVPSPTTCGVGACAAQGHTSCTGGSVHDDCTPGTAAASDATCNGVDDDCSGQTDEDYVPSPTTCGVGACRATGATSCNAGVEQNGCTPGTPAASDATCNGVDDDCDGTVDENYAPRSTACGTGACSAAGTTSCVAGVEQDSCHAGTPAPNDATCDGIDDDCDGTADENYAPVPTSCGAGSCQATGTTSCVNGHVQNSCTAGTAGSSDATCNGIDDDCDGSVDEDYVSVSTSCGVGACAATGSSSCVGGVVQTNCSPGTAAPNDATCNGIDDDCDGSVDENYGPRTTACGVGACQATGVTSCTAGIEHDSCSPGTPAPNDATCNGIDDDCNGTADEDYVARSTACGVGACAAAGTTSCSGGVEHDSCTPGTPAASDATCNGIDDDCNGTADEDYVSFVTNCGVGACRSTGTTSCSGGQVQNSCTPGSPAANDATCNGVDDDCNGTADEDYAPVTTTCGVGACQTTGATRCTNGAVQDGCTPGTPAANDATCNGIDDDCNGTADEDYAPVATICGTGACAATGSTTCTNGTIQDNCHPGTPAPSDATCNGIDDDCSGSADEDYVAASTTCGTGACASTGTSTCVNGQIQDSCHAGTPAPSDATCNGIDDDCDGTIDENYIGTATTCGVGACAATGTSSCVSSQVQSNCHAGTPAANDATCNGVDDDCDGAADEDFGSRCAGTAVQNCVNGAVQTHDCVDGNACNGTETCTGAGICTPGTPIALDDGNPCTTDACNPASGPSHAPTAIGSPCGANRACDGQGDCISAPEITTQPADVTVVVGQPATFTITVSGSLLTYQWRRFGQAITGATGASYTKPETTSADDTSTYSVVVTNPAGSVTSREAKLTTGDDAAPVLAVNAPASPTNEDFVTLTGTATDNSGGPVTVSVTSNKYPAQTFTAVVTPATGAFAVEVPLKPGANALVVTARDPQNHASQADLSITQGLTSLPRITITSPVSGSTVTTDTVTVTGSVRSTLPAEQIRLNLGTVIQFPTGANGEYSFSFANVRLVRGQNSLLVTATTPEGAVTAEAIVTLSDGPAGTPPKPPEIRVESARGDISQTVEALTVSGTVTATRCVQSVTVNSVAAGIVGAGPTVSFSASVPFPAASEQLLIKVDARDCDGASATVNYTVRRDTTPPVISVPGLLAAPAVNAVTQAPYALRGTITEKNLAGLTTNNTSIKALPGAAPGTWDFAVDVTLPRNQDNTLTIEAWDYARNRSRFVAILRFDAAVSVEIVSPTEGAKFLGSTQSSTLDVVARIAGFAAGDTAIASIDNGTAVPLSVAGETASGSLAVPTALGQHSLAVEVRGPGNNVLGRSGRTFSVASADSVPLALERQEPSNGEQNVEPNQFIAFFFNRPIDPAKLTVQVFETVHGLQYDKAPAGADITLVNLPTQVQVDRDHEVVPGGPGHFHGQTMVAFYPAREYAYGAALDVLLRYDGHELARTGFRVRPLPTLLSGFVIDPFFRPIAGLDVRLDDLGATTTTDEEGYFAFGFGPFANAIPGGRHKLVVNPQLSNRRYGTIIELVSTQEARHTQLGVVRTPLLAPDRPFEHVLAGAADIVLNQGGLALHAPDATLHFPDGRNDGDVYVQALFGPAVGYPVARVAIPLLTYSVQPMGIEIQGPVTVDFALPKLDAPQDYLEGLPQRVLLVGLDPNELQIVPVGVGTVDRATRRVRSEGPLHLRRADFVGLTPYLGDAAQARFADYVGGKVTLPELVGALQAGQ